MWYKLYIHVLLNSNKIESKTDQQNGLKDLGARTGIQTALFFTQLETEDTH